MKQSYTNISIIKSDTKVHKHEYYFHSAHTHYGEAFVFKTWLEFYPPGQYQLKPDAQFLFAEVLTRERTTYQSYILHRHFVMLDDARATTIMQTLDHISWHSNIVKRCYKVIDNPFLYNPHLSPELPF